jgi:hypothetical protein
LRLFTAPMCLTKYLIFINVSLQVLTFTASHYDTFSILIPHKSSFPIYVLSTIGIWCYYLCSVVFCIHIFSDFLNVIAWLSYLCFGYYAHIIICVW